jgi:uncharacterized protein YukE
MSTQSCAGHNKENTVMAQLGSDVAQLDDLSAKLNSAAADIKSLSAAITGALSSVWWQGNDRTRFEATWGDHQRQLSAISDAVVSVGNEARAQAAAQRSISE